MAKTITLYEDTEELIKAAKEKKFKIIIKSVEMEIETDDENHHINFSHVHIEELLETVFDQVGINLEVKAKRETRFY